MKGEGNITVWINSPGGDVFAAAQIYNMLMDYKGNVTVRIDGLAASAASVIAMAGTTVEMSPVGMLMVHNPSTAVIGNTKERQAAIDAELAKPTSEPIVNKPAAKVPEKTGRAADEYRKAMLAAIRSNFRNVSNVLQEGVDAEGGYLVPEE